MPKHTATHMEPAQTPSGLPDDKPKWNLTTQPGRNFAPMNQVRRPNKSELKNSFRSQVGQER